MIYDCIENLTRYEDAFPAFKNIADFIEKNPLAALQLGITEIDGKDLYVNVMEYCTHEMEVEKPKLENHHTYADVHMIDGEEKIRYLVHPAADADIVYDEKNDVEFFKSIDTSSLILTRMHFTLFLPHEAHEPGCMVTKSQNVRKYVFKIKM